MITLKYGSSAPVSSSTANKELHSLGLVGPDPEINYVCVEFTMGQILVISADTRFLDMPMILGCLTLNSTYRLPTRLHSVVICS